MPMDNAQDAPFAERSVRMWPFECGRIEGRWGDRGDGKIGGWGDGEIRSLEKVNGEKNNMT